jgi:threonine-phosphate decarboxylase
LTKSFALAGLRIGYGISSKKIISILNKIKIPWNVSGIAQDAASLAISNPSYLKTANILIEKESRYLHKEISKLNNFQCNNSSTNFILINTKIKSNLLQNKLLKKKILVRDCSSIRGLNKNCIRIAVKTHKENKKLIKALKEI